MPTIRYETEKTYEDVFIIGNRDDGLEYEDSRADDSRNVGSIIGMFPTNSTILFMEADTILHLQGFTILI